MLETLMVGHGESSAGSYLADPTSPIPSHCASIVTTSSVRVKVAPWIILHFWSQRKLYSLLRQIIMLILLMIIVADSSCWHISQKICILVGGNNKMMWQMLTLIFMFLLKTNHQTLWFSLIFSNTLQQTWWKCHEHHDPVLEKTSFRQMTSV